MSVKLLSEHHLEFLSLKGGSTGLSKCTLVKMPHCWKSHVAAHMSDHSYWGHWLWIAAHPCTSVINLDALETYNSTVNILKCWTLSYFCSQDVGCKGWNSQNACQISKHRRPWSDCFSRSSLIWACTVCLGLFCRQIAFKILGCLQDKISKKISKLGQIEC